DAQGQPPPNPQPRFPDREYAAASGGKEVMPGALSQAILKVSVPEPKSERESRLLASDGVRLMPRVTRFQAGAPPTSRTGTVLLRSGSSAPEFARARTGRLFVPAAPGAASPGSPTGFGYRIVCPPGCEPSRPRRAWAHRLRRQALLYTGSPSNPSPDRYRPGARRAGEI